ncbi:hypothetical protein TRIATDRAFT_299253 [Trichoderma atroviride IMI 206040]|uniref:Uncharacterized protein n=1 Tax=Hypocrea atroviridis (strain ATCC 20476 / IMI 206040) TaxID=452589 RepID=G9NRW1_HYPAI|nr:uncharacterized protein TRIATDRAFT_299253 [Trichoderma atroviride IMI 206040]EHK46742.1 hypothetical protein TRIATDRAFT_299253 [Trichoderma atroviride IMI 206040]
MTNPILLVRSPTSNLDAALHRGTVSASAVARDTTGMGGEDSYGFWCLVPAPDIVPICRGMAALQR